MSSAEDARRKALLERLAACDLSTLERLAALLEGGDDSGAGSSYLGFLRAIGDSDIAGLIKAEQSYGDSWKARGGVDTYHMLTRKWNRLEERVRANTEAANPYDIFAHIAATHAADGVIDDVRDLRRYLILVEAETAARAAKGVPDSGRGFLEHVPAVVVADIATIEAKEKSHGASWKKSGGASAFMIFARKWDRIKARVTQSIPATADTPAATAENILEHIPADRRVEPLLSDIRDLRQYLMLVEAEMAARGAVQVGTARDNRD